MKIKAKRLSETAKLPTYGSEKAACADLYANLRVSTIKEINAYNIIDTDINFETDEYNSLSIAPHETMKIPTGWAFQPEPGYMLQILQRSGLASKGLIPLGGILDEDYTGEVIVILLNTTDEYITIHNQNRVAQLAIRHYYRGDFEEVEELDETTRGESGFGSTDK